MDCGVAPRTWVRHDGWILQLLAFVLPAHYEYQYVRLFAVGITKYQAWGIPQTSFSGSRAWIAFGRFGFEKQLGLSRIADSSYYAILGFPPFRSVMWVELRALVRCSHVL